MGTHRFPLWLPVNRPRKYSPDNSGEGFNVTHLLPWQGSISGSYNRSTWNSDYLGYSTNGTINLMNAVATVRPRNNLSVSGSASYSDNLAGQLAQSVIGVGGIVPEFNSNQSSDSLDLLGVVTYTAMANLQTDAFVERRIPVVSRNRITG